MKLIHTHRAHCQLCVRVQAIDVTTGIVAKHGYTVAGGYFRGTCPGSDQLNLHVERTQADASIAGARKQAATLQRILDAYNDGSGHPALVWNGEYRKFPAPTVRDPNRTRDEEVKVDWGAADRHWQERGMQRAKAELSQSIRTATDYANNLQKWADKVHGKVDPYQVKDLEPRDWTVGDEVTIGSGRDKFTAKIEAIEQRQYKTFGFRRGAGSVMCDHMQVTRPARPERKVGDYVMDEARPAKALWYACRDVKRKAPKLAAELKKAGLL